MRIFTVSGSLGAKSDTLIPIMGRAALSSIVQSGKRTYTVRDVRIRFAVHGANDMRMDIQIECAGNSPHDHYFVSGSVSLAVGTSGILRFWYPIVLNRNREASSTYWEDQNKQTEDVTSRYCFNEEGLEAAFQSMSSQSNHLALRQLAVRLQILSNFTPYMKEAGSYNINSNFQTSGGVNRLKLDRSRVVIGLAVGYGIKEFRRFVGSLRATGYMGVIILGVSSDIATSVQHFLLRHHVEMKIVEADSLMDAHKSDGDNAGFYSVALPRWQLYRKWISEINETEEQHRETLYFLTDTRDVYFQRDPFKSIPPPAVHNNI